MKEENKIILYQDDNEITRVSVRFADEDVWLTQNQLAEIYDTTQQNISLHIENIYKDGELELEATHKKATGVNLVKLESRLIPEREFEYRFYFDIEASVYSTEFLSLMCELHDCGEQFKYFGTYAEII